MTECWIIDDYCVQFSSEIVYSFDLYNKTYQKYNIADLDQSDLDWLSNCLNNSYSLRESLNEIRSTQQNKHLLSLSRTYSQIYSTIYLMNKSNLIESEQEQLEFLINNLSYTFDVNFINGSFYSNNERINWGRLGRNITDQIMNK